MLMRWEDFDRSLGMYGDLRRRMEDLFQEFDDAGREPQSGWPRVRMQDAGAELRLTADLPGLSEKDVKITLNQGVLTLEGERRSDAPQGYAVHRQERAPVRFARGFSLPCKVNGNEVRAAVKDGVLTVTLPKAPESQPQRIEVQAR